MYNRISFLSVTAGVDYYISAGTINYAGVSNFSVICEPSGGASVPANDECAAAVALTNDVPVYVDNSGATNLQTGSSYLVPYRDVWYKYTATCTGQMIINVTGATSGFALALQGSCDQSSYIRQITNSRIDQRTVGTGSVYYFRVGQGTSYQIPIGAYLTISCVPAPPNDYHLYPTRIVGTGVFTYSTIGADDEECNLDVWYIWTATCTGWARATTCGNYNSTYDNEVGLFTLNRPPFYS